MHKNCPFCSLQSEKWRIICQGIYVTAFLSNPRMMEGHILIAPKRHVEEPWELHPAEMEELYRYATAFQRIIVEKRHAPGCDVRQNYRPFIPQGDLKVDHLHFHVLPRWPDTQDELYMKSMRFERELFKPLSDEECREFVRLYRDK